MKKSGEIIGLTVVSIHEGKELGTVNRLVIDAAAGKVAALLVDDQKWYLGAKVLPFSAVNGLGEYAVTINSEADAVTVTSASAVGNLLAQDIAVIGSLVVTRDGNSRGTVVEFGIAADGAITECIIEASGETYNLPAQRVVTYGKNILVIAEENELPLRPKTAMSASMPEIPAEVPAPAIQPAAPIIIDTPAIPIIEPIATVVEETEQQAKAAPPQTAAEEEETDALARMFEEKQRKYLLGKIASRRIEAENGTVVIAQGEEITEAVLQKAKSAGKFVELSMSIY